MHHIKELEIRRLISRYIGIENTKETVDGNEFLQYWPRGSLVQTGLGGNIIIWNVLYFLSLWNTFIPTPPTQHLYRIFLKNQFFRMLSPKVNHIRWTCYLGTILKIDHLISNFSDFQLDSISLKEQEWQRNLFRFRNCWDARPLRNYEANVNSEIQQTNSIKKLCI